MSASQPAAGDYALSHRLRVRYAEIDAQGVVFNAHYLSYFDTAINEAFRDTNIDWLAMARDSGCDVQLVKSLVEYKSPLHFDEELDVCVRVGHLGNSSICWELAIFGLSGDLRATGEIVWVYADIQAKASRPIPDWLRDVANKLIKD